MFYTTRRRRTGAIDTGLFPRAKQRREDRAERRSGFRVAKAFYGSARQARLHRDPYGGVRV